ncbi:hypothetical protein DQ04_23061000 [Trypanosoma grayi]|uniref:hypothetical protein n=1 Tax=Trypanosoma grayi TaxID=71804 RepID=UPI0004F4471F|nr:hypothetical protein DQ04_23061000 [Trypanosoma grayi]KEG05353.1 hypothetical protein DQ04_23061000 [Trypanosoma grayi]
MARTDGVFVRATRQKEDPFLRGGTASRRFLQRYRTYPYPVRMAGLFLVGFVLGSIIETFACKTHMYESVMAKKDMRRHDFDEFVVDFRQNVYESVMAKKDMRRHDFDEFVVDFRQNVERWQQQDMTQRRT